MFLRLLYPERCILCDEIIGAFDGAVCEKCKKKWVYVKEPCCKKCGKQLENDREEYCPDCSRKRHLYDSGIVLFTYTDDVRKSIYRFKYGNRQRYGLVYADMIVKRYGKRIKCWKPDVIIPVPLHKERLRKRGFNQAEIVAGRIGELLDIPMKSDLVLRIKNTKALKLIDGDKRREALKSAFKLQQNKVKLDTVVLVDDIYTTGSTINEISGMLRNAGVKRIYFITVASGSGQ